MLSKIRAGWPELPFFHWGDLDVGGLRILAHLRKNLGEVEPLAMDGAVCDLYLKRSQPLVEASFCVKTLQLKQLTTPDIRINE